MRVYNVLHWLTLHKDGAELCEINVAAGYYAYYFALTAHTFECASHRTCPCAFGNDAVSFGQKPQRCSDFIKSYDE